MMNMYLPLYTAFVLCLASCIGLIIKNIKIRKKNQEALNEIKVIQKEVEKNHLYHKGTELPNMNFLMDKVARMSRSSVDYHVSLIKMGISTPAFDNIYNNKHTIHALYKSINHALKPFALIVHDAEYLIIVFASPDPLDESKSQRVQKKIMRLLPKVIECQKKKVLIDYAISSMSVSNSSPLCNMEKVQRRLSFSMIKALQRVDSMFYHDESLYKENMMQKHIIEELQKSLAFRPSDFYVMLQPIYKATDGLNPVSFEALLRWKNRSKVGPNVFIPIISKKPYLHYELTKLVISKVSALIADQIASGKPLVPISINIGADDLAVESFVEDVYQLTNNRKAIRSNLIFEIIENEKLTASECVQSNMKNLSAQGIKFAIDDFGSGYANFEILRLPYVSFVKIDKKYTNEINEDKTSSDFINNIIQLCSSFKLKVVVEGVENNNQFDALRKYQNVHLQGYYLSRPRLAKEAFNLLE
ncbi:EAL domain-containing protein [Vibrio sp. SCSIO 43137]|uniref:EAL domain-containing protein n=1 Tax=Vibrio sp. SCSIO 43137 TaxID=3021011 RepID=UPI00230813A1|nr:EAL domain-containing protein [Vibrio sp. SCSIO 43137]WCE32017.1 EAL domain-containing protein [Vibrio sp. SCSIO 43137]